MFVKQLSVFIENRQGRLQDVLDVLKKNGINIISLSLADTSDYGMLRLIVSDPIKGFQSLKNNGFSTQLSDILVVNLLHQIGQLEKILTLICHVDINIEYMYTLSTGTDDASLALKCSDMVAAEKVLSNNTMVKLLSDADIAGV